MVMPYNWCHCGSLTADKTTIASNIGDDTSSRTQTYNMSLKWEACCFERSIRSSRKADPSDVKKSSRRQPPGELETNRQHMSKTTHSTVRIVADIRLRNRVPP